MFVQIANSATSSFESGVEKISNRFIELIFQPIIWLLIGFSILLFVYGIAMFILNSESSEKETGKKHMIWGLVGLFIIFAVWGFVAIVGDTVNSLGGR